MPCQLLECIHVQYPDFTLADPNEAVSGKAREQAAHRFKCQA